MTKLQKIKFNEAIEYAMHILDTSRIDEHDKEDLREAIELISISGGGKTRTNNDARSLVHGYVTVRNLCARNKLDCCICPLGINNNGRAESCMLYIKECPKEAEERLVEYFTAHPEILNKKEKGK